MRIDSPDHRCGATRLQSAVPAPHAASRSWPRHRCPAGARLVCFLPSPTNKPPCGLAPELHLPYAHTFSANTRLAGRETERHAAIVGYAAYAPPGSSDFFRRILPESVGLIEAWLPNFGDCLFHTIREILARGHDS